MKINYRFLIAGILVVGVIVGGVLAMRHYRRAVTPITPPTFAPLLKTKGSDSAPVKIVEYSDFECPSCRMAIEPVSELFKKYPDKLQLTYRHFPLSSHRWSIYAHQAAECMNLQGKFWAFHDAIYEKQQDWSSSTVPPVEFLAKTAKELGADVKAFGACMADVAVTREIYSEKESGSKQQVTATPTFLIGPDRFVGPKELKERGENVIRKILGLPPEPVSEEKKAEAAAPANPAASGAPSLPSAPPLPEKK